MSEPHGGHTLRRLATRPTWLLSRAYSRSTGILFGAFDEHGDGLRGYHFRLLAALEVSGPASQADLGRDTGIDRSDVTAAMTELEARGLVVREVDPEHRRRKIVTLTPLGAETLEQLDALVEDVQEKVLEPLSANERAQLVRLLTKLAGSPRG